MGIRKILSEGRMRLSEMKLKASCTSLRYNMEAPKLYDDDEETLLRSFTKLLGSFDLPADKEKAMNGLDNRKKMKILVNRSLMKIHQSPEDYLEKLRSHIRKKKSPSKEVLRGLEVSLRTYPVEWVHDFLKQRDAIDILVTLIDPYTSKKLRMTLDQFQIALECMRVVLKDSSKGLPMAINHSSLFERLIANFDCISIKSRILILNLLAIACQKSENGQQRVLKALAASSAQRQLMTFITPKCNDQMSIVATMNLIRTLLNSKDLNYRVFLQYDFHRIGLDSRIERLLLNESSLIPKVIDEIKAYKSSLIDVNHLVGFREAVEILKKSLRHAQEQMWESQRKLMELEAKNEQNEMRKKGGMSVLRKVDKETEVDSKTEISPALEKGDAEEEEEDEVQEKAVNATVSFTPPPPPPPPPPSAGAAAFSNSSATVLSIRKQFEKKSVKLPSLHWSPLRPHQIRGTIFNDIKNDEKFRNVINFAQIDDKFSVDIPASSSSSQGNKCIQKQTAKFETLLESNRQRNISIMLRKLNFDADSVVKIINNLDFNEMKQSSSSLRLITNLAPKEIEVAAYRKYVTERKNFVMLSDEDKFLLKLSLVERLQEKLTVMEFMANFEDSVSNVTMHLTAIARASLSLVKSEKFKEIVQIILSVGNYMNGNKSSAYVYGFHLCGTLEKLNETRSGDKKTTLLDYIVTSVIHQHFEELLSFHNELSLIETAARVSMKEVASEVANIRNGWKEMCAESELSSNSKEAKETLKEFKDKSETEFNKLIEAFEAAQMNFQRCLEYFGETVDSIQFFATIEKFIYDFKAMADKVKPKPRTRETLKATELKIFC